MTEINKYKQSVTIEASADTQFSYWKKWIWNKKLPLVMVIANYPTDVPLLGDNLTSMLIRNEIVNQNEFGGLIIANLFNQQVRFPSNISLLNAIAPDGLSVLIEQSKIVDKIIIATGSLPIKYDIANQRLSKYFELCSENELLDKLFWLLNSGGKKVHPLAVRDEPWQYGPVDASLIMKSGDDNESDISK